MQPSDSLTALLVALLGGGFATAIYNVVRARIEAKKAPAEYGSIIAGGAEKAVVSLSKALELAERNLIGAREELVDARQRLVETQEELYRTERRLQGMQDRFDEVEKMLIELKPKCAELEEVIRKMRRPDRA